MTPADRGAGEILITSIDRDGTMTGYDLALVERVARAVNLPVIASGGAGNYEHMRQAIQDAGVDDDDVSNERTGIIMGSGGPSTRAIVEAADVTREKGARRVGPFAVPKAMSSTNSATLATPRPTAAIRTTSASTGSARTTCPTDVRVCKARNVSNCKFAHDRGASRMWRSAPRPEKLGRGCLLGGLRAGFRQSQSRFLLARPSIGL